MVQESVWLALSLAGVAGFAIPLGGVAAAVFPRLTKAAGRTLRQEVSHGVVAFGGGALLSAVCLVLVPEGTASLAPAAALFWLGFGGLCFMLVDRGLKSAGGGAGQLMAMLLDFLPEAMALGALLATDRNRATLLSLLIALQNLPEGFNAFREMQQTHHMSVKHLLLVFCGLAILGPLAALCGLVYLTSFPVVLGAMMLFSGGGILYLMFQDIAPQAVLEHHWLPPLGAVLGFMLGLSGYLYLP